MICPTFERQLKQCFVTWKTSTYRHTNTQEAAQDRRNRKGIEHASSCTYLGRPESSPFRHISGRHAFRTPTCQSKPQSLSKFEVKGESRITGTSLDFGKEAVFLEMEWCLKLELTASEQDALSTSIGLPKADYFIKN